MFVLVVVLTLAHLTLLWLRLPVFKILPDWFWNMTAKPASLPWLLGLVAVFSVTVPVILRLRGRHVVKILLLIALGYFLQLGFAFLEGRGLDGMRDRMVTTGHAQFAKLAVTPIGFVELATNYETYIQEEALGDYAPSKPPGQLLLYMMTERVANTLDPQSDPEARLATLRTFASLVWPLLSFLVIVPLYLFGTTFFDEERATLACVLYLVVPSVELITLHTDQVFFPTFLMTTVALGAWSSLRQSALLAVLTGVSVYLALYCSFALLPALPIIAAVGFAIANRSGITGEGVWRFGRTQLWIALGLGVSDILFRVLFGYDILRRYQAATAHHIAWKGGWSWNVVDVVSFILLNSVEYAVWLGIPVAVFAVSQCQRSVKQIVAGAIDVRYAVGFAVVAVYLALVLLGRTKGEVARLWMFLIPLICLIAADELRERSEGQWEWGVALVVVLQAMTVHATKISQDFW